MTELKNILHVEDEPDIREITTLALATLDNINVKSCSSGEEALDSLLQFHPDLILVDVMMPSMDGPTFVKKARAIEDLKAVPVVFMTAKSQAAELDTLKTLHPAGIIQKPFDPAALLDQLRTIHASWVSKPY